MGKKLGTPAIKEQFVAPIFLLIIVSRDLIVNHVFQIKFSSRKKNLSCVEPVGGDMKRRKLAPSCGQTSISGFFNPTGDPVAVKSSPKKKSTKKGKTRKGC